MFWLVDIFKFIFSLAILGMHSYILGNLQWEQDWLYPLFFYTGVPYFFIASGFFYGKKYYSNGYSSSIFTKFCHRLCEKLIVFEPISQIQVILLSALAGVSALTISFETVQHVLFYPYGGMWYIQALLVAGFLLIPFIKYRKEAWIIPIGMILYIFALISSRYYFIIEDNIQLKTMIDDYLFWFVSPKNGLFIGFLYMGLGVIAARLWDGNTLKFRWFTPPHAKINLCFILSICIFLVEIWFLRDYQGIKGSAFFITQPLFIFFLFLFSAKFYKSQAKCKYNTKYLRNMSISIYLLHPPIQRCFLLFQEFTGIKTPFFGNPYSLFLITLFCTLIISYPIYRYKDNRFTSKVYRYLV